MREVSILEETVKRSTEIEEHLRSLGGKGSGISELTDSVASRIPEDLQSRIRQIATIRNRFVHENGFALAPSEGAAFLFELDSVTKALAELGAKAAASPREREKRPRMPYSNAWTEIYPVTPYMKLLKWPSTPQKRLVFFRGTVPEVLPVGVDEHKIPWTRVTAVAHVSMGPSRIALEPWSITTSDGIPMDAAAAATLRPRDDAASIARIAMDGMRDSSAEVQLASDRVFRSIQAVISSTEFDRLPSLHAIQTTIETELLNGPCPELSLDIVSVTLASVQPSDPKVRDSKLQDKASEIELKHLRNRHELEKEAADRRHIEAEREWKHELAKLRDRQRLNMEAAKGEVDVQAANREFELAKLRLQLEFEEKIAQQRTAAEIAKAERIQIEKILPLAVREATKDGRYQMLIEMAKTQGLLPTNYRLEQIVTKRTLPSGMADQSEGEHTEKEDKKENNDEKAEPSNGSPETD